MEGFDHSYNNSIPVLRSVHTRDLIERDLRSLHRHVHVLEMRAIQLTFFLLHVRAELCEFFWNFSASFSQHVDEFARSRLVVQCKKCVSQARAPARPVRPIL